MIIPVPTLNFIMMLGNSPSKGMPPLAPPTKRQKQPKTDQRKTRNRLALSSDMVPDTVLLMTPLGHPFVKMPPLHEDSTEGGGEMTRLHSANATLAT